MAKMLLALGVLLLIVGGGVFVQGPSENPWSFLAWGIAFAAGVGTVVFGLRRAGTRALRILNGLLLVPHLLFTAFFALVLVVRLA